MRERPAAFFAGCLGVRRTCARFTRPSPAAVAAPVACGPELPRPARSFGARAVCLALLASLSSGGAGCAGPPAGEVVRIGVVMNLPSDRACRPVEVPLVRLVALGDFPTTDSTVVLFDPRSPPSIDTLPSEASLITLVAESLPAPLFATRLLGPAGLGPPSRDVEALLLPLGRACALASSDVRLPPDAALAPLPDGGLLIVGGRDAGGRPWSRVVRLEAGTEDATVLDRADELFAPRAWATATLTADLVVIAGGAPTASNAALYDRLEVYDVRARRVDVDRARGLVLATPRRDHGAGALPDGRVLVVGGIGPMGAGLPAEDAEVVDVLGRRIDGIPIPLPVGRRRPLVATLDDGTTVVAGGEEWRGRWVPSGTVFALDLDGRRFVPLPVSFTPRASAVAVPLPGARVAYLGLARPLAEDSAEPAPVSAEILALDRALPRLLPVPAPPGVTPPVLATLTAAPTPDGRVLIAGRDARGTGAAFVLDPATGTYAPVLMTRDAPSTVAIALLDGTTALLDSGGAALVRTSPLTPLDSPGALLPRSGETDGVVLDDVRRWREDRGLLIALADGARLDLVPFRFADLRLELDAEGAVDLLLYGDGARVTTVRVDDAEVGFALCHARRGATAEGRPAPVTVTRTGDQIVFHGGPRDAAPSASSTVASCVAPLPTRVGLGLRAAAGTTLRALRVTRLPR
jgi:hypothetical protein